MTEWVDLQTRARLIAERTRAQFLELAAEAARVGDMWTVARALEIDAAARGFGAAGFSAPPLADPRVRAHLRALAALLVGAAPDGDTPTIDVAALRREALEAGDRDLADVATAALRALKSGATDSWAVSACRRALAARPVSPPADPESAERFRRVLRRAATMNTDARAAEAIGEVAP